MSMLLRWVVAAGFALMSIAVSPAPLTKTAKDIMTKLNKGSNAPLVVVKRDLQKDNPNWPEIQEQTTEYAKLAGDLQGVGVPKGDETSWKKLCNEYATAAKELNNAAKQKNKSAALAAHAKLTKVCSACHKAHRD